MTQNLTMRFKLFLLTISLLKSYECNESESSEVRRIEITPYYDTIIFSDVIDIINELNKNINVPFANSESVSDENVDDLLLEYQHYLDKAHDQRRAYLGKLNQTKNKVPLLRRDNFVKTQIPAFDKYADYYKNSFYNPSIFKMPATTFNNPLDLFIPLNAPLRYLQSSEQSTIIQKKGADDFSSLDRKPLPLPLLFHKSSGEPIKSPCICPSNQIPCKCSCKQCIVQMVPTTPESKPIKPQYPEGTRKAFGQNPLIIDPRIPEHLLDDMSNAANTLNVKIKVDIQLPKNLEGLGNYNNQLHNRDSAVEYEDVSKEFTSNIRLPTTSFNFPIPLNMFGYKKMSKTNRHDTSPFRKITIHKKKKSRANGNNNNRRHRKKLITFHNVKISNTQTTKPLLNANSNMSDNQKRTEFTTESRPIIETSNRTINVESKNITTSSTELNIIKNTTQFEDSIYFMVNISNNSENETDDVHKTGNSIELELTMKPNASAPNLRKRRDVTYNTVAKKALKSTEVLKVKKTDKTLLSDSELLFWPSNSKNVLISRVKNISDIILERENKKTKLNMSKETIRHNKTVALEQAIFGQVDWNDMDAVVPTFISFVGKYINGILTFCSETICHSIKCEKKICIHRTCLPDQRSNHIGHCSGSNKTDSIASMESIMDLPSNVAFEIVEILQDRMFGKLYGKVTLCISSKCISFVTSKKTFTKSKCSAKTLNKTGHCPNLKKMR